MLNLVCLRVTEKRKMAAVSASLISVAILLLVCVYTIAHAKETYTTRWDNINVDEILTSDRLLKNYVNCLLDAGPCTPDGSELKKTLPDALETECSKCSVKQKENSEKVIHFLIDNKKEDWAKLEQKYDPEGEYRKKYEDMMKQKEENKEE